MLRYIILLSLTTTTLWSFALPTDIPTSANTLTMAEWTISGYTCFTDKNEQARFQINPYYIPQVISSQSFLRLTPYSLLTTDDAFKLVTIAHSARAIQRLSNDDYEMAILSCFNLLMKHFLEEYLALMDIAADEALLSSYTHASQNAERVRCLEAFTPEQRNKLSCYKITFLIGAANIAGKLRNNQGQLDFAEEAKKLIESLPNDIVPTYADGRALRIASTLRTCLLIISRANKFLLPPTPSHRQELKLSK